MTRGFGSVYRRKQRRRKKGGSSPYWWISFTVNGVRYQESSGSKNREDAVTLLQSRHAEVLAGKFVGIHAAKTSFDDLVALLEADYQRRQRRSLDRAQRCIKHLRPFFAKYPALGITFARAEEYIAARLGEKPKPAAHATVRQEIATLGRMLTLAVRAGKLLVRPPLPLVEVRNTRTGFFSDSQVRGVLEHLPEHLRPLIEFGWITGWRRRECLGLTWDRLDWHAGIVRLDPLTTKNDEGRTFPFGEHPRLAAVLMEQRTRTETLQRERGIIVRWVFHREGKKIADFRDSWMSACRAAGCPGRYFHDFRRTAVRNLVRAGVTEPVAMSLTGHKTRSVFDRYNITSTADQAEAVRRLASRRSAARVLHGAVSSNPDASETEKHEAPKSK